MSAEFSVIVSQNKLLKLVQNNCDIKLSKELIDKLKYYINCDYLSNISENIFDYISQFINFHDILVFMNTSKSNNKYKNLVWNNLQTDYYDYSKIPVYDYINIHKSIVCNLFYTQLLYFNTCEDKHNNYIAIKMLETEKACCELNNKSTTMINQLIDDYINNNCNESEIKFYHNFQYFSELDIDKKPYYTLKKMIPLEFYGYNPSDPADIESFENDMKWMTGEYNDKIETYLHNITYEPDIFKYYYYDDNHEDSDDNYIICDKQRIAPLWYNNLKFTNK